MGLTNWRGNKVRKSDIVTAKNYLKEEELKALNNLVEQYLVFAEGQAMRRITMNMRDWATKLDGFLSLNDRDILSDAGTVTHELAKEMAEGEYKKFKQISDQSQNESDFDKAIKKIKRMYLALLQNM